MLRCKLSTWCLASATIVMLAALEASLAQDCTKYQYKKVTPSGTLCIDCPRCPAGYGLLIQCGTTIAQNARVKCQQCTKGSNYSVNYDYEQCLPCSVCSYDQVMTPCTEESNTLCHHKCNSKENYYEKSSGDCRKCSWCCGDSSDVVKDECVNKGMPHNQRCTADRRKKCTSVAVKTNTMISSLAPITSTSNTVSGPTEKPIPNDSKNENAGNGPQLNTAYVIIIIAAVCLLIVVVLVIILSVKYKRKREHLCHNDGQQMIEGESNRMSTGHEPLPGGQPPAGNSDCESNQISRGNHPSLEEQPLVVNSHQDDNIQLFEWFNMDLDNRKVKDVICKKLDYCDSFADVACYFKMDQDSINLLIYKSRHSSQFSPTEAVLEYVERSCNPSLPISEFRRCLCVLNKRDVLKVLDDALANCNTVQV